MGILSVASFTAIGATAGAAFSWRSFRAGTSIRELTIYGAACLAMGTGFFVYLSIFSSLLGGDPISSFTPSFSGSRGERRTLLIFAIISAGIGTLIAAGVAKVASRGKA
jgi:hypothetical protein